MFSCACNNCTPCNEDVESIREEYVSPAEGGKETGGLRVSVSKPSPTRTRAEAAEMFSLAPDDSGVSQ